MEAVGWVRVAWARGGGGGDGSGIAGDGGGGSWADASAAHRMTAAATRGAAAVDGLGIQGLASLLEPKVE